MITNAERYVYFENQFFITSLHENIDADDVENLIGQALFERIKRAHENEEVFYVFATIPLFNEQYSELSNSRLF